jgi:hypothetical protein
VLNSAFLQLLGKVGDGIGELGEDENFLAGMFFGQKFMEFGQLIILIWLPLASEFKNGEKSLGVLLKVLGKVFDKNIGAQPIEIAGVVGF